MPVGERRPPTSWPVTKYAPYPPRGSSTASWMKTRSGRGSAPDGGESGESGGPPPPPPPLGGLGGPPPPPPPPSPPEGAEKGVLGIGRLKRAGSCRPLLEKA